MVAAATFFKGQSGGEDLPHLEAYLWCSENLTYRGWLALPENVRAYWRIYRSVQAQVEEQKGKT